MPDVQGFEPRPQLVTGARVVPSVQVQPDVQVASGSGVQGYDPRPQLVTGARVVPGVQVQPVV